MEIVDTDAKGSGHKVKRLTWLECSLAAGRVAETILDEGSDSIYLYGIPRGGTFAALLMCPHSPRFHMVGKPTHANVLIDDLIDSGQTRDRYKKDYPTKPFEVLFTKENPKTDPWIEFPWERTAEGEGEGVEENIRRILQYIGEDVSREGLVETPKRVVRSWQKLFSGYGQDPVEVLKFFKDDSSDEMVLLKDIEFFSTCEHHMLPFWGKAHVAYIPDGKVVGISKLARLIEIFARRLQIQERLCQQVTNSLDEVLKPKGSACVLEAQHFCMTSRGVEKQNSIMVTSSLTGHFRTNGVARAELLSMIKGGRT